MSRLTDLIARAKAKDSVLGDELEREFKALGSRRAFGLNFERHHPESVELPGRPVRLGDKVRLMSPRGIEMPPDPQLWRVIRLEGDGPSKVANVALIDADPPIAAEIPVADLVVVAEFRDLIYPGLVSTGSVEQGGDKPFHTIINGENFHVLEALTYTHKGKIDAIYIDPPYNTGARDWKYNNDYVGEDDLYRHSKWLAMMERRLKVAKELLNPVASCLIATIDEKEFLRLGLLLEQLFPEAEVVMITSVISAKGAVRPGRFSRVEEHIYFVFIGNSTVKWWTSNMLPSSNDDDESPQTSELTPIPWLLLRRREPTSVRQARPNQFYPIFVDNLNGAIHSIGDPLASDIDKSTVHAPPGTTALWPLKPDGTEMLWGLTPEALRNNHKDGFVRINRWNPRTLKGTVQYLQSGVIRNIRAGHYTITGYADDGSVQGHVAEGVTMAKSPKRVWNMKSHNAETGGTNMVSALLPGRRFPFPKSLYAVEDALRFILSDNPCATVLDFFAGSGTTAHAVMRLNRQDDGCRQCISVTNNEVAASEQAALRAAGLRPGDPDWEKWGICDFITKPRIRASITGKTPEGDDVQGVYRFTDEFPMAEGFQENAEFFTLTYESHIAIGANLAFQRIAPLLWMRAGAQGPRIDTLPEQGWKVVDTYGLLVDLDRAAAFCEAVSNQRGVRVAYVVTDDDRRFQAVARALPVDVEPVRLYESYLSNFRFSMGR